MKSKKIFNLTLTLVITLLISVQSFALDTSNCHSKLQSKKIDHLTISSYRNFLEQKSNSSDEYEKNDSIKILKEFDNMSNEKKESLINILNDPNWINDFFTTEVKPGKSKKLKNGIIVTSTISNENENEMVDSATTVATTMKTKKAVYTKTSYIPIGGGDKILAIEMIGWVRYTYTDGQKINDVLAGNVYVSRNLDPLISIEAGRTYTWKTTQRAYASANIQIGIGYKWASIKIKGKELTVWGDYKGQQGGSYRDD